MIEPLKSVVDVVKWWWGPSIDEKAFHRIPRGPRVGQQRFYERPFNWLEQEEGGFTPQQRHQQGMRRRAFFDRFGGRRVGSVEPLLEQTGGGCQGACGDPSCQLIVHV